MENSKINNGKNRIVLSFFMLFFVSVLCFCGFFQEHYSTDLYFIKCNDDATFYNHITNGRFVSLILYSLLKTLKFDYTSSFFFQSLLLCISICVSTLLISNELFGFMKNKTKNVFYLLSFSVLLAYCNCFVAEWFCFTECDLMYAVGIVCSAAAAVTMIRKKKLYTLLLLFLAFNSYQITIAYFVFWFMLLLFVSSDFSLSVKLVFDTVFAAFLCGLTFITNKLIMSYLSDRIRVSGRYDVIGTNSLIDNFKSVIVALKNVLLTGNGMIGSPWLLFCIIIMSIADIILIIHNKNRLFLLFYLILIVFAGTVTTLLPQLLVEVWMPPRTITPLMTIFSVLLIFYLYIDNNENHIFVLLCVSFLLIINGISSNLYATNIYVTNQFDRSFAETVCMQIEDYESETGNTVTAIAFSQDSAPTWRWPVNKDYMYDVCVRACMCDWSSVSSIYYYTGRNFEKAEIQDELYEKLYKDTNYNKLDLDEQMICQDDTAYLLLY